jgi:hypothetical protein
MKVKSGDHKIALSNNPPSKGVKASLNKIDINWEFL